MNPSSHTSHESTECDFDYAIIGMGIGGLALGALLANAGNRVVIFDQHEVPGGYGHTFRHGRYSFCAELHYVWDCGPGERVFKLLEKLGLESSVTFHQLNPAGFDRIIGPGVDYTIGNGFDREIERLSELFPACQKQLREYFELIAAIHHQLYDLPIGFTWRTVLRSPRRYGKIIHYLGWTLENLFDRLEFPQTLRLILAGQSAIFWLPPRDLSLVVHAGGVGSYNQGAYYPEQSFMHVMRSLLRKIRHQSGCRSMLSTEVKKIHVDGGRVHSVVTDQAETITAKQFLFDADAQLSLDLIGREHFPARFLRKLDYDYGCSVVSVYLGLRDFDLRGCGLGEENIFWHPELDLNAVYDHQLGDTLPPRPYFFCNVPTLRPHEHIAPPGGDEIVMVAPCSYDLFARTRKRSEAAYQELKHDVATRIIATVESELAPGMSRAIEEQVVGTPLTNERFVRAPKGNCYSTPLDPKHVNLRRLNYRSPFPNFFYVGASSSLPGFATIIHFANLLYEELTGDRVYD